MKRNLQTHQRGIIGWVIAVMLAGLALAMLTPFVMGQHKRSAEDTDRAALEAARTAVVSYAMTNGRLPTPDAATARCPVGVMPTTLGVNNWGKYGSSNPFCLDTNSALRSIANQSAKVLCAAGRRQLAAPTVPFSDTAPAAFVLFSTGNDHTPNLSNAGTTRVYESDNRGIDDSAGATTHYDDQVVSYPLSSLLTQCANLGGAPTCNVAPPTTTIKLGSSAALTGSCSNAPNCSPPYAWSSTPAASAPVPLGAANGNATPTAPDSYDYTLAGCNEFDTGPTSATKAKVIVEAPICTLTPSPATITTIGGSSTLTLSCDVAPTAYSWSGGYGTVSCSGATCVVTPPSTQSFGVTPTFGSAPSTWAPTSAVTATVTVNVASTCPVCTSLGATPTSITSGASSSLAASCSNTPDSYRWSGGFGTATCTTSTCPVSPTSTTLFTATAIKASCADSSASTTVTVTSCGTKLVTAIKGTANQDIYYRANGGACTIASGGGLVNLKTLNTCTLVLYRTTNATCTQTVNFGNYKSDTNANGTVAISCSGNGDNITCDSN